MAERNAPIRMAFSDGSVIAPVSPMKPVSDVIDVDFDGEDITVA